MDYDQLIKNWHTKASEGGDYFSRFVFEYLSFIAFLKKRKYIESNNDRTAIQSLKQDEDICGAYLATIQKNTELIDAWNEISAELTKKSLANVSANGDGVEEIKWWNNSSTTLNNTTQENHELAKGVLYGLDDWGNMVEFWYSIRNNLFHGGKDPQEERDRLLIENGYKTLSPLVKILLAT